MPAPAEDRGAEAPPHLVATPLVSRDRCLGALLLEMGRPLDMADTTFLGGLGRQLSAAFERIQLTAESKKRQQEERTRLEQELARYRQAADRSQLLYRSPGMHELLARTQQVALTDATVLITGESGTGKELLARTLHELSSRREKPLVVVDCSAIAATLADSELFGHEAGAYTGAQQRRIGRLAEADGGTVLLDEVGELPLDVQGKLLRFVQEKQLTAVGSNRPKKVDVRILAATNRDLGAESAAGRFRQDLYHRLNVVSLVVPPLRERADDILHLAEHFLESFSTLYRKDARRLSPAATVSLLRHAWPGNVRELQHRIMQAVIFCPREELAPADLGLSPAGADAVLPAPPAPAPESEPGEETSSRRRRRAAAVPQPEDPWGALRTELSTLVEAIAGRRPPTALPLGRFLATDLVLEADAAADGVARRGAALLGLPEATFRHRLQKAKNEIQLGQGARPPEWSPARAAVARIVALPRPDAEDRLERAENVLIGEIRKRIPEDDQLGSLVLGVTVQTFRRRVEDLPA
ncbi:MAG TPA: sigma-54 dependent transcriptional regulator [Thermoanaerobaculia bacterium]|nr:sigma-54 dependent transcriptional regulator [Thermoanaerobaculia bacterium]